MDIVERLNTRCHDSPMHAEHMMDEAAAEIERLRAQVERMTYDGIHTCHDDCQRPPCVQRREIERLRAELLEQARIIGMSGERELALRAKVEKLREALEYISKHSFGAAYGCDHVICYECLHTHEKARAALTETSHDGT